MRADTPDARRYVWTCEGITYQWYRDFLNFLLAGNHETWFSWVTMVGELAVALGLLLVR